MDQRVNPKPLQKAEFNAIYDEFVEFGDYCVFLCDAVSCLLTEAMEAEPDVRTVMGLRRQCGDLKERVRRLEQMFGEL